MSRSHSIALLLGLLLIAAPFTRQFASADDSSDEDYDDDEGEEEEASATGTDDPDTVVLGESNFEEIVSGSPFALVEFYAPWCGHCQTLAPHYAKASTLLKSYEPKVVIGKVDATKNSDLSQKYGIQGFPTIKWFVDGELVGDYSGGRTTDEIVQWIKKKTGPVVITVQSADALSEFEQQSDVVMFGLFSAFEGPGYQVYSSIARKTEGVIFTQSSDLAVAKAAGLSQPGIAVIKNFLGEAREVSVFSGALESEEAVKVWVDAETTPLTIEFSEATAQRIFNSGVHMQLIFWAKPSDFAPEAVEFKALREVAKLLKGRMIFVTSNNAEASSEPITNFFKLEGSPTPVVLGFVVQGNKKFKFQGKFTKEELLAFATSVLDGTAVGDYKSAPVPEEPTHEGVTVVVGTTFQPIVLDPSKDVFLEVYAPWCGHCKSLAPVWSELAAHFASVDSVVIAKMDGTENDHPSVETQGYPTLLFFPASSEGEVRAPIPYEGGRDLEALIEFVEEQRAKAARAEPGVEPSSKDEL